VAIERGDAHRHATRIVTADAGNQTAAKNVQAAEGVAN
jgi:hypothetical protein